MIRASWKNAVGLAGVVALLAVAPQLGAQSPDLNALLREVEQAARQGGEINREREARFLRDRSKQQALLREAEAEQKQAQARIDSQAIRGAAARDSGPQDPVAGQRWRAGPDVCRHSPDRQRSAQHRQ